MLSFLAYWESCQREPEVRSMVKLELTLNTVGQWVYWRHYMISWSDTVHCREKIRLWVLWNLGFKSVLLLLFSPFFPPSSPPFFFFFLFPFFPLPITPLSYSFFFKYCFHYEIKYETRRVSHYKLKIWFNEYYKVQIHAVITKSRKRTLTTLPMITSPTP